MPAAAAAQHTHEVGHNNLAAAGARADARRLDDRRAEDVVVLDSDITRGDADTDVERLVGILGGVTFCALLNGDRGGDRIGRASEVGEQAVPQTLDEHAAVIGDRGTQHLVVRPPQRLGVVLPQPNPRLGRADKVSDHHCRELRSHQAAV